MCTYATVTTALEGSPKGPAEPGRAEMLRDSIGSHLQSQTNLNRVTRCQQLTHP